MSEKEIFRAIGEFENFRALEEKLWLLSFKQTVDNILVPPSTYEGRKMGRLYGFTGIRRPSGSAACSFSTTNEYVCYYLLKLLRMAPEKINAMLQALEQSQKVDFGPKVNDFVRMTIVQDFFSVNINEMMDAEMFSVFERFQQTRIEQNILRRLVYFIHVALCTYRNCHMIIDLVNVLYPVASASCCATEQEARFMEALQFCKPIFAEFSHGLIRESGDKLPQFSNKICDTSMIPFQDINHCLFICGFDSMSEILHRYNLDIDSKVLEAIHINYSSSQSCHLFDGITSIICTQKDVAKICADFYATWNTNFADSADSFVFVQKMFSDFDMQCKLDVETNTNVFVKQRFFFFEMEKKGIHLLDTFGSTLQRFVR